MKLSDERKKEITAAITGAATSCAGCGGVFEAMVPMNLSDSDAAQHHADHRLTPNPGGQSDGVLECPLCGYGYSSGWPFPVWLVSIEDVLQISFESIEAGHVGPGEWSDL